MNYRAVVKLRGLDQGDDGFVPEQATLSQDYTLKAH